MLVDLEQFCFAGQLCVVLVTDFSPMFNVLTDAYVMVFLILLRVSGMML